MKCEWDEATLKWVAGLVNSQPRSFRHSRVTREVALILEVDRDNAHDLCDRVGGESFLYTPTSKFDPPATYQWYMRDRDAVALTYALRPYLRDHLVHLYSRAFIRTFEMESARNARVSKGLAKGVRYGG